MATTEPKPVKQLRELLQEQQEPFILELYLVEKGYLRRKSFNQGNSSFNCCHGNSRKSLKRSVSFGLVERSKKGIPHCSKVLTAVYNQVISLNQKLRIKSSNHRNGNFNVKENKDRNNQEAAELDRFSSASSSTVFNSCSGSDAEETSTSHHKDHISLTAKNKNPKSLTLCNLIENEAVTDRKQLWKCIDENRQLSPVSVLEEVASHRGSPLHNKYFSAIKEKNSSKTLSFLPRKVTEDSILSASLWEILVNSSSEKATLAGVPEVQELVPSDHSSKYLKSNTVLQQTRQLLFDCVREIVETQGRKEKQRQQQPQKEYLASDEIGKFIGEKINLWGKQSAKEFNLTELLELEFVDSTQEWIGYEPQKRKIGFEIADAILEDIRNELVIDMIGFSSPITGCYAGIKN